MSCGEHRVDAHCDECGADIGQELRARLFAAEKERDDAQRQVSLLTSGYGIAEDLRVARARVAQLEEALEPTAENVRAIATALSMPNISPREQHRHHAERALAAIRARAGLEGKEGT